MPHAITRAISLAAPVAKVLAFLADPTNLTRYAPGFARSVAPQGAGWLAETSRGTLRVHRTMDPGAGTVDFKLIDAAGASNMLFTRTVPVGDRSELVFTLLLPESVPAEALQAQGRILEEELAALKAFCEQG